MLATYNEYKKKHPRLSNHAILAGISLVGCLMMALVKPGGSVLETIAIGMGYVGLGLIALTLLIGPINMLKVRKNPVNINFRRDAGIWAGIAALVHVVFAFLVEIEWGGTLLGYFLYTDGSLKLNLFGISNFIGVASALVITFLLVLSNNKFLKKLKGKRWKNMQRFNYLLFALVLGHAFTQQVNNMRGELMIAAVTGVALAVMVAQSIGFVVYRRREQARKVEPVAKAGKAMAIPQSHMAPPPVRGYGKLKIASAVGMVAMLGVGAGVGGLNMLNSQTVAAVGTPASDEVTTSTATPAASATAITAPTATATTATTTQAVSSTAAATAAISTTTAATSTATTTAATTTAAATATATPAATATATAAATAAATTSAVTVTTPASSSGTTHTGRS